MANQRRDHRKPSLKNHERISQVPVDFPFDETKLQEFRKKLGIREEQVERLWQSFTTFQKDLSQKIDSNTVHKLFEQLHVEMLDAELNELVQKQGKTPGCALDFNDILLVFSECKAHSGELLDVKMEELAKEARVQMDAARQTTTDRAQKGVARKWIVRYIRSELKEEESCEQLPQAAFLLILFIAISIMHQQAYLVVTIQKSIEMDMMENANFAFEGPVPFENGRMGHKTLYDVNSIGDFWGFLNLGLIPLVFREEDDHSEVRTNVETLCKSAAQQLKPWPTLEVGGPNHSMIKDFAQECPDRGPKPLDVSQRGMYLYYNRIIGGLRLQQERASESECYSVTVEDPSKCYFSIYNLEPDLRDGATLDYNLVDRPLGETYWLRLSLSQAAARSKLRELEDLKWFSMATQRIQISFLTYNAIAGMLTITYVNLFVTRGGHFWKQVTQTSMQMYPYEDRLELVILDSVFVLCILKILVGEIKDVGEHVWQLGIRRGLGIYIHFWNLVDWISVGSGAYLILRTYLLHLESGYVRESLAYYDSKNHVFTSQESTEQALDSFMKMAEDLAGSTRSLRGALFGYPFVMMFRLFKTFAAQPRLAVVTSTLVASAVDVAHFGITFLSVFFAYTVSGVALFGREMDDFSTFPRALNTCMRVILGDFDWTAMVKVGRQECGLWFWSFTFLICHILLNMLLSIIMDTYMDVKGQTGNSETIFSQAKEIYRRWRGKRHHTRLDLEEILKCLDTSTLDEADLEGAEDHINLHLLLEMVKGLKVDQGRRVLLEAQTLMDRSGTTNISLSDAMTKIQEVEAKSQQIHRVIEELFKLSVMLAQRQQINFKKTEISNKQSLSKQALLAAAAQELAEEAPDDEPAVEASNFVFKQTLGALQEILARCSALQLHTEVAKEAVTKLRGKIDHLEQQVGIARGTIPQPQVIAVRRLVPADVTVMMNRTS